MGSKSYWRTHYEKYNNHWESDEEGDSEENEERLSLTKGPGGKRREKIRVRMLPNPSFKRKKRTKR